MARDGFDAGRCSAFGPGLEKGIAGQACHFTVNTKGAGCGAVSVEILGPSVKILII